MGYWVTCIFHKVSCRPQNKLGHCQQLTKFRPRPNGFTLQVGKLVALKICLCQLQEAEAHDTAFLMTFFECFEKGDILEELELLGKGFRFYSHISAKDGKFCLDNVVLDDVVS